MFMAAILFRCKGVVKFPIGHCTAAEKLVVHVMIRFYQHNGMHVFDVVVAWFIVEFHIDALEPAAHGVTGAEGYGLHDGIELA